MEFVDEVGDERVQCAGCATEDAAGEEAVDLGVEIRLDCLLLPDGKVAVWVVECSSAGFFRHGMVWVQAVLSL